VLADSWVFPGGSIRPDDLAPGLAARSTGFKADDAHAELSRSDGGAPADRAESFGYFVAAARELFEEAGVLLARTADSVAGLSLERTPEETSRRSQLRLAVEQGRPLLEILEELGLALALDQLTHYGHWITPTTVPVRFDTRFFVAVLPDGQVASPSPFEMVEGEWIRPEVALEAGRSGGRSIHFATVAQLRRLAEHRSLNDLLHFVRTKPIRTVMPPTREVNGRLIPYLPPEIDGRW
jgi:8-oxo-dGTP pyrophosphatase MutT (NUDIX family)